MNLSNTRTVPLTKYKNPEVGSQRFEVKADDGGSEEDRNHDVLQFNSLSLRQWWDGQLEKCLFRRLKNNLRAQDYLGAKLSCLSSALLVTFLELILEPTA